MSNLQLIEALCDLVERQSQIIRDLSSALEQMRCLSESEQAEISAAQKRYSEILGDDEMPDEPE